MHARSKAGAGFTIVETMIFLAISGLMFALAISAMSGKQQQTEFQTSVGTLKSDLNQVLSNVSTGSYIDQISGNYVQCSGQSGTPVITANSATPPTPDGTCTAIGEIIEFGENGSNQQQYYLVPVFGCNYVDCGQGSNGQNNATDLADAEPRIDSSVYQSTVFPFGLSLDTANYTPPGAIGVFSFTSFNGNSSGNSLGSGSQHVELFAMPNVTYDSALPGNLTPGSLVAPINNSGLSDANCPGGTGYYVCSGGTNSEQINPTSPGLSFCVDSGTSDSKSALFTLGGSNDTTSVNDQIFNGSGCS